MQRADCTATNHHQWLLVMKNWFRKERFCWKLNFSCIFWSAKTSAYHFLKFLHARILVLCYFWCRCCILLIFPRRGWFDVVQKLWLQKLWQKINSKKLDVKKNVFAIIIVVTPAALGFWQPPSMATCDGKLVSKRAFLFKVKFAPVFFEAQNRNFLFS